MAESDPFSSLETLPCEVCGRVFVDAKRLYRHLFDVHAMSKDSIRDLQRRRRMKKVSEAAMSKERPVFACTVCQQPYLSKLGLNNHMEKSHNQERAPTKSMDYIVCPISMCQARFQTYFDLADHANEEHRQLVLDPEVFRIHRLRFEDYDKFHDWKSEQEQQTESRFYTRSTETKIRYGRKVWLMKCLHTQRTSKTVEYYHDHCPAFIRACERFNGTYEVVACFGHLGHPHFTQNREAIGYLKRDFSLVNEYPASFSENLKLDLEQRMAEEEGQVDVEEEEEVERGGVEMNGAIQELQEERVFKFEPADLQEELGEFLDMGTTELLEAATNFAAE